MRTVVKVGGSLARVPVELAKEIARLAHDGEVVVVHGGSLDCTDVLAALKVPEQRLMSPDGVETRYTTAAALDGLMMAMRGRTQARIVIELLRQGLRPIGLSGADAGLVRARRKKVVRSVVSGRTVVVRDNLAGTVTHVSTDLIDQLLRAGTLPVICPPAVTAEGDLVNVNADRLAASVAVEWAADNLLLLTAVDGVLDAQGRTISTITTKQIEALPDYVDGGMRMKLHAAAHAARHGVHQVLIAGCSASEPLARALRGESCTRVRTS